jgi:hypothetical protein
LGKRRNPYSSRSLSLSLFVVGHPPTHPHRPFHPSLLLHLFFPLSPSPPPLPHTHTLSTTKQALRDGIPDADGNVKGGYKYTQNASEIFQQFFGTDNPFADFGFGQSVPFASRLKRPGPKKMEAIVTELPCSLEELFNGCQKKLSVTRKRPDDAGELVDVEKVLVVNIKPGTCLLP